MNLKRYASEIFTFVKDLVDMVSLDGRISNTKNRTGKKNGGL